MQRLLETMQENSSPSNRDLQGCTEQRQPCHIRYDRCPAFLPDQNPPGRGGGGVYLSLEVSPLTEILSGKIILNELCSKSSKTAGIFFRNRS